MEQPRGFSFRLGRIAVRRRRLEGMLREYHELYRGGDRHSPHDRLVIVAARRVYWNCFSYALEAAFGRFDICETLTRGQLDSAVRLRGAALHGDGDFYAQHLRDGLPLNQLREDGGDGASLDLGHLLKRLDSLARRIGSDLPSSGEMYGDMSGYVHLSPDLMALFNYDSLEHEGPGDELHPAGPPGGRADEDAWLDSARRFEACTELFAAVFAECLARRSHLRG